MTKTTTPKAPRMTKTQKLAQQQNLDAAQRELDARNAEGEDVSALNVNPETLAIEPAEAMPEEVWVDPIKWVDETPTIDQAMASLVTTKTMKKVKTVKTGVGAQILQLIAEGELSNKEIVAKVLEDNPLRKTTYACVAWYKSQVAAGKIDLPVVEEETSEE